MPSEIVLAPSNNTALSTSLMGIENALYQAALANIRTLEEAGQTFTETEKAAMADIEALKLVNGMDLAAVLLRGKLLRKIEDGALWSVHPAGYNTMEEMARDQGISLSELSNIKDMVFTIFPYMENELNISVADTWERIGKSNFRELVATLKAIITGSSTSTMVNNAVNAILNDVYATAQASGQTITDEEARRIAVDNMLTAGEQMTNRDLRRTIRPTQVQEICPIIAHNNGLHTIVITADDTQFETFKRKVGTFMDPIYFDEVNSSVRTQMLDALARALS